MATLTALAAAGRNPTDITPPSVGGRAGSGRGSGGGGDLAVVATGGGGASGSGVLVANSRAPAG
jgi:hypothetical protein